jgi:hypothetical protein
VRKQVDISLYKLALMVTDMWGLTSYVDLNPVLIRSTLDDPLVVTPQEAASGSYSFTGLFPGEYRLVLDYKSFIVEKTIPVLQDREEHMVFPAAFTVETTVLNARGETVEDVALRVSRDAKVIETSVDANGQILLELPPGVYRFMVFEQGEVVGKRTVRILDDRVIDLITLQEPLYPTVVFILCTLFVLGGGLFSYRKRDPFLFLTLLGISFVIVAVVSPWWMLSGSSVQVQTSSVMYLTPPQLVTTTITSMVIAGELASLPPLFIDVIMLLPLLTAIACILVFSHKFLERFQKNKASTLVLLGGVIILICTLLIFVYGMNELASVGVGGFIGDGTLDIGIPGEDTSVSMVCSWGPSTGFYLYLVSILLMFAVLLCKIRTRFVKKS